MELKCVLERPQQRVRHHSFPDALGSAAMHKAVRLLKALDLTAAYEAAWHEWVALGESGVCERTTKLVVKMNEIAELRPITPATGRALRAALADAPDLDPDIETDIAGAIELLDSRANGSWPDN